MENASELTDRKRSWTTVSTENSLGPSRLRISHARLQVANSLHYFNLVVDVDRNVSKPVEITSVYEVSISILYVSRRNSVGPSFGPPPNLCIPAVHVLHTTGLSLFCRPTRIRLRAGELRLAFVRQCGDKEPHNRYALYNCTEMVFWMSADRLKFAFILKEDPFNV